MEADRVETLLRNSRPEPRPGFREELAEELFPARRSLRLPPTLGLPRPLRIQRPLLAAAATATAMAAGVLALSLAGGGPLAGSDGDGGVEATTNCRTVTVTRRERVPYLVRSADGRIRIGYRYEKKQRQVRRCP